MTTYDPDPDVVRWGLHQLLDVCSLSNGAPGTVTCYDKDFSRVDYVREGYFETEHINVEDELIAHTFQEELLQLAEPESSHGRQNHQQVSVLPQDWFRPGGRNGKETSQNEEDSRGKYSSCSSPGQVSVDGEAQSCSPEIADESILDGEVGKRLNQMVPVPHVPKINGDLPSADEEISDHQRLMGRLQLYDLVEQKVLGDGNCQLKSCRQLYEGYVPMDFDDYLKKIKKNGEWGDHVTLQSAADSYGLKIFVITSFRDTCYIEILPHVQKSNRIIFLSFWAEVHYNSIYPLEEFPVLETKKKKKWWRPGC